MVSMLIIEDCLNNKGGIMFVDLDINELAYRAMGFTEEQVEEKINNLDDIDVDLDAKYGVDFETYRKIVKDLIFFTPKVHSAFGNPFHAFVDVENKRVIVRQEV